VEYCSRIANPGDRSRQTQRGVSPKALVENYPAHEFVIDYEEALALGFKVSLPAPEIDFLFDRLRPHLDGLRRYIGLID
jgi:hypothetical protein